MRVLFLAPQPFLSFRGTPLSALSLVTTLAEEGHTVDLLTYPQGQPVQLGRVRHLRSGHLPVGPVPAGPSVAKALLDVPFALEAACRVLGGSYDVVHAVEEAAHLIAPFARLRQVPLVADVDSWIPEQLVESRFLRSPGLRRMAEWLNRAALRQSSLIITPCRSLAERVQHEVRGVPVVQLPDLPLQAGRPVRGSDEVALWRRDLALEAGPLTPAAPVVAYSGSLEALQGVELLVDAVAHVAETVALIMGGNAEQIARLRERARRLGVEARCRFAGTRTPAEVPALLELATVLVVPRLYGHHTGFKISTYLAAGKPIVATRIPAHTQVLDESRAFLVEPTAPALAQGIRQALADPQEAERRGRQARAFAESHLSRGAFRARLLDAYARLETAATPQARPVLRD